MSAFHLRKRNLTRYLPQSNRILNLGTASDGLETTISNHNHLE